MASLDDQLRNLNLRLKSDIVGDGNCLFRALSFLKFGTQSAYPQVRIILANFVRQHPLVFNFFLNDPEIESIEALVSRIEKDKSYGGVPEIIAACNLFKVHITILQDLVPPKYFSPNDVTDVNDTWYLVYDDKYVNLEHYNCALPMPGHQFDKNNKTGTNNTSSHTEYLCGKKIARKQDLDSSIKANSSSSLSCPVCNKGFTNKSNLDRHKKTHSSSQPFTCGVYDKGFSRKAKPSY